MVAKKRSSLELRFLKLWEEADGPELAIEHRFHPVRKWRFDFACIEFKVAIEVEGGTWSGGRHTRGSGYAADCEKYNEATMMGWSVLRLTSQQVNRETVDRIAEWCRWD